MYEWIVSGVSSFFVSLTEQKSSGWPRSGNPRLSAGEVREDQRQGNLNRAAKRSYHSVHSSDGITEHSEIKRPRRDAIASIVKKTVSEFFGRLHLRNPFTPPCSCPDQIHIEEQLGVDEIQSGSVRTCLGHVEMNRGTCVSPEKSREAGYNGLPPSLVRKRNGTGPVADRTKGRDPRRSLQLLPSHLPQGGAPPSSLNPPGVVPLNRTHRPCLAVEQAMKESDREHYRRLVEIVSEKYTKNKPLPFAQSRLPVNPLLQEVHKPSVFTGGFDSTYSRLGPVRGVSVWRGAPSSSLDKGKNEKNEAKPTAEVSEGSHFRLCVQAEDTIQTHKEKLLNSVPGPVSAERQEPAKWKQPVDVDLSAEVAARLNLVDQELTVFRPQQTAYDGQDEFPRLTKEMMQEVNQALAQKDPNVVLSSAFKLRITQRDLATLQDSGWLNDEVINFYMNLLMCRSEQGQGRKVYAFSTFFFPKLHGGGHTAVRRWTKAVDIFQYDIILVPLHLGVHWSLAVIDFKAKCVKYYDSMGQRHDDICNLLLHYLKEEYKVKRNKDLEVSKWVVGSLKAKEIPQQNNSSDCGVFACKYADYIAQGRPLTFNQIHMPYFRRKMIWEILNKCLL